MDDFVTSEILFIVSVENYDFQLIDFRERTLWNKINEDIFTCH